MLTDQLAAANMKCPEDEGEGSEVRGGEVRVTNRKHEETFSLQSREELWRR